MTTRSTGFATAVAAALALWGPCTHAQTPPATPPMPNMPAPSATLNDTDKLFMLRAAQGDMGEISSSQMALKKAKSADVKQVAQTLITDHSKSLQEGTGLATLLGLTVPKDPGIMNEAFAAQLKSANGKDFDEIYMAGQVEAHENTVALYNMELSQGQDPQVKAFASKYLPGIEGHTVLIYQVAKAVSAPDSGLRPASPPTVAGTTPTMDTSGTPAPMGAAGGAMNTTGAGGMNGGAMPGGTATPGTPAPGGTPGQ